MRVVGISEGYHDAGYCVLDGDEFLKLPLEERGKNVQRDYNKYMEENL
jgi:predicted NodU family carbamoyl transferase